MLVYLISVSEIVFYLLHSISVLAFYIDVVLTISITVGLCWRVNVEDDNNRWVEM